MGDMGARCRHSIAGNVLQYIGGTGNHARCAPFHRQGKGGAVSAARSAGLSVDYTSYILVHKMTSFARKTEVARCEICNHDASGRFRSTYPIFDWVVQRTCPASRPCVFENVQRHMHQFRVLSPSCTSLLLLPEDIYLLIRRRRGKIAEHCTTARGYALRSTKHDWLLQSARRLISGIPLFSQFRVQPACCSYTKPSTIVAVGVQAVRACV